MGELTDLGGGVGRCDSETLGINDSGVVVGVIDVGTRCGQPEVFLWDGQMHRIGCPSGASCWPYAINARGDVVGDALGDGFSGERDFIYRDGEFQWLDELIDATGWTLEYAIGINDAGQIAGFGTLNGQEHAFVLTPR